MLNELSIMERGMAQAGIAMPLRHSNFKHAGVKPTVLVRLNSDGYVATVHTIPMTRLKENPLWS